MLLSFFKGSCIVSLSFFKGSNDDSSSFFKGSSEYLSSFLSHYLIKVFSLVLLSLRLVYLFPAQASLSFLSALILLSSAGK